MILVDAHCHLESEEFADSLATVLAEAVQAGVRRLVTCAVTPSQWPQSKAIAQAHPEVAFALGIHPWFVQESDLAAISELHGAARCGACAIGEIGLDKKNQEPSLDLQIRAFEAQLDVARSINLPVVVHCRGAFNEVLESLKRVGAPEAGGLLHAFAGSPELADAFKAMGFSFSMGRSLTYRNSKKREAVLRRIYPERFLLETDSPDMPPVEVDSPTNVPSNLVYMLRAAADIMEEPVEQVAAATTRNACNLFGFKLSELDF